MKKDSVYSRLQDRLSRMSGKTAALAICVCAAVLLLLPQLGLTQYMLRTLTMIGIYAMMALSLNIVVGYMGQVSMGHAAFVAVGAYASAILSANYGVNFFVAAPFGALCAAICGVILGMPTLRLSETYFVIATLGFSEVVKVVTLNWKSVTNGALGIKQIPRPELFGLTLTNANGGQYYLMLVLLAFAIYICYAIKRSKVGRALNAIRTDSLAAELMGVDVSRQKVIAFTISAAIAGYVGGFYASMVQFIDPNTFSADTSTIVLSCVILGGSGSILGMIVGAVLLISFPEAMRFLQTYRFLVYGMVLILMMRFRPQGIFGGQSRKPYVCPKNVRIDTKEGVEDASA